LNAVAGAALSIGDVLSGFPPNLNPASWALTIQHFDGITNLSNGSGYISAGGVMKSYATAPASSADAIIFVRGNYPVL
jgi:hypothetical protein